MKRLLFVSTVVFGVVASTCVSLAATLAASDIMEMYTRLGYKILSLKLDDTTYEMRAKDRGGNTVELVIDATTGAQVTSTETAQNDTADSQDDTVNDQEENIDAQNNDDGDNAGGDTGSDSNGGGDGGESSDGGGND